MEIIGTHLGKAYSLHAKIFQFLGDNSSMAIVNRWVEQGDIRFFEKTEKNTTTIQATVWRIT